MHVLAFILAVAAAIVFLLATIGREYPAPRLVPLGLLLTVVAWIVQLTVETSDPLLL